MIAYAGCLLKAAVSLRHFRPELERRIVERDGAMLGAAE